MAKGSHARQAAWLFGLKIKLTLKSSYHLFDRFWNRPLELYYRLLVGGRAVVFQFHSFPKAWLPFGILNLLIEFSLKQSGLLRLSGSSVTKKSSFTEEQGKHGSTQIMSIHSFPPLPWVCAMFEHDCHCTQSDQFLERSWCNEYS